MNAGREITITMEPRELISMTTTGKWRSDQSGRRHGG